MRDFFLLGTAIVVVILATSVFFVVKNGGAPNGQIACTMEAKLCPDGSAVGRTGPNCEFAKCPEIKNDKADLIQVSAPLPGTLVTSPLDILGTARGTWYFEASFPVRIYDANNTLLGTAIAQAQSDWMTENFVPFKTTLVFSTPTTETGTLVFVKDNPSGLPQNDDSFSIPVVFSSNHTPTGMGTLQGTMTIGPVCPVERIDNPCLPTPEMFAARKIAVYRLDKKTLVRTITPNGTGGFSASLPLGNYYVDMASPRTGGPGGATGVPATVTIKQGATVSLTISVDTGIR